MELFAPAWKSKDINKALKALEKETNNKSIEKAAQNAQFPIVRMAATNKLTDQVVLSNIIKNEQDNDVRATALKRIIILENKIPEDLYNISEQLKDSIGIADTYCLVEALLFNIAGSSDNEMSERITAVQQMNDEQLLYKLAMHFGDNYDTTALGKEAIKRISDDNLLLNIVLNSMGAAANEALKYIKDEAILRQIANNSRFDKSYIQQLINKNKTDVNVVAS